MSSVSDSKAATWPSTTSAVLVHPPFADPTQAYPSLPTLKGWLNARGLDATVVDLNVIATHHVWSPAFRERLAARIAARFVTLDGRGHLDFEAQREYVALHDARRAAELVLAADPSPIEVFQSEVSFYDPVAYSWARLRSDAMFEAMSAAWFPYRFGFNHATHHTVPWSFGLLERYAALGESPLADLYAAFAAGLGAHVRLVGVSVVFPSQIPDSLAIVAAVRRVRPDVVCVLGGPALHQVVVHLDADGQRRVLDFTDAIALFEGEATLEALVRDLDAIHAAPSPTARFERLRDVANLMTVNPASDRPHHGPRWTLDLRGAPPPNFDDLDLDAYLAPERTLLYAPTRGCYWGKCSFCYYGLAETATASYREIGPADAARQLGELTRRHGARHVYLSCDVLSPSYAVRLATALLEQGVDILWSSDLKIERYFTAERCALLYRAGLRAAAFGIESGSDRILTLIRKGSDRATMTDVNRSFHAAGVATEWMTFTDHPNETVGEALETADWIASERDHIGLFIVGRFGLERGSDIAQNPAAYGVDTVTFASGDDLRLYALYTQAAPPRTDAEAERIDGAVNAVSAGYALHPYPWAGANSTHHTQLHFTRFGQSAFKTHFQGAGQTSAALPRPPASDVAGLRGKPRYDVDALRDAERAFLEAYLPRALYTTLASHGQPSLAPLSLIDYNQAAAHVPVATPKKSNAPRSHPI